MSSISLYVMPIPKDLLFSLALGREVVIAFTDFRARIAGSHQIRAHRRKRDDSNKRWETGDGDVAGDLVPGV